MAKKILIVVGILAVIGMIIVGVAGYGVVKVIDEKLKEKEPEFRKYVTMTIEEQNAYVEKNLDFLINTIIQDAKNDNEKETFEKIKADPSAKQAGIEFGRSIISKLILSSDAITSGLNEETKSKLQTEADAMSTRFDAYSKVLEKYDTEKSK